MNIVSKKIIISMFVLVPLFLFITIPLFSQPALASASCTAATKLCIFGEPIDCDPSLAPASGGCGFIQFIQAMKAFIGFLVKLAIPLAAVFILYGGFVIMTASGSTEKAASGKKILTAAIWGLIIIFGAWLILFTIFQILESVSGPILQGIRQRLFGS